MGIKLGSLKVKIHLYFIFIIFIFDISNIKLKYY